LQDIGFLTLPRRTIILSCSGIALFAGLALLYWPLARHWGVLLVAGVAIAALGGWQPDLAMFAAQASIAGVACALLARLLAIVLSPAPRTSFAIRDASPSSVEVKSTEPYLRYEGSSHATTATAPAPAPVLLAPPVETPS
jgi:hypothetical protein